MSIELSDSSQVPSGTNRTASFKIKHAGGVSIIKHIRTENLFASLDAVPFPDCRAMAAKRFVQLDLSTEGRPLWALVLARAKGGGTPRCTEARVPTCM